MSTKKHTPIKDLLAAMPEGTLTSADNACMKALSACLGALREPPAGTHVFSVEARGAMLTTIKAAIAETLQPHVPRITRPPGRPNVPRATTDMRHHIAVYKEAIERTCLTLAPLWRDDVDARMAELEKHQTALDNGAAAVANAGLALKLDLDPFEDARDRLSKYMQDWCQSDWGKKPGALVRATTVAQMALVLKTLSREASGAAA